jgi:hypothetical protein
MKLEIIRSSSFPATQGEMYLDGTRFGYTLELPWLENKTAVSCIPVGSYRVDLTPSRKFGRKMLEVLKVPGRVGIRVHAANTIAELRGCIAVARNRSGDRISSSLVPDLMELAKQAKDRGEEITLEIRNGARL